MKVHNFFRILFWLMGFCIIIFLVYVFAVSKSKMQFLDKYHPMHVENLSEVISEKMNTITGSFQSTTVQQRKTWPQPPGPYDVIYPYKYDYLLNEPDKCKDKTPFVILLIPARTTEMNERNVIRKTWGNENLVPSVTILRLFFMGSPASMEKPLNNYIQDESDTYHDIIQHNFIDTYNNLTLKTMTALEWIADYCPDVAYIMKIDSDMFLNTEYLVNKLLKPQASVKTNYFTGFLMIGGSPIRNNDSKWYMPEHVYSSNRYPPFCSGTGYVLSGDLARKIVSISSVVEPVHLEDVYVGLCLERLNVKLSDSGPLFHNYYVFYTTCGYAKLITSHYFDADKLLRTWNDFQSNKGSCAIGYNNI